MASTSEPELVLVDPDGDLILKVGNEPSIVEENENKPQDSDVDSEIARQKVKENRKPRFLRIRVCSKFMTMSSPVFKAMLNGSFREGQLPLSPIEPPTLELPEDEPKPMVELCKIFHHKWDTDLDTDLKVFPSCVLPTAVAADKYGCTAIVRSWFHHQFLKRSARARKGSALSLAQFVSIAYILDDVEAFYFFSLQASKRWCLNGKENNAFISELSHNHVPSKIHELLERIAKAQLRETMTCCQKVIEELFTAEEGSSASSTIHSYIGAKASDAEVPKVCIGQAYRTAQFIQALIMFDLWPPLGDVQQLQSLEDAIEVVQEIGKTHVNDKPSQCQAEYCDSCAMDWGLVIGDRFKKFENGLHGLCLVCLKKGKELPASKITTKCIEHNHGFTSNWAAISDWDGKYQPKQKW